MTIPESLPDAHTSRKPPIVGFWEAFRFWAQLGFISFGGPAGQISIMHQELVERRRWISEQRFLHALNYCMLLPGPEAQQLATYIGWMMHRTRGGIVAGTLFVLPSLLLLIALSWVYIAFGNMPLVVGIFSGVKPAVTAIVVQAVYRIGSRVLRNGILWGVAAGSFVAIFALNVPFPAIVAGAALIGYIGGRLAPDRFNTSISHQDRDTCSPATLIDDDTPPPEHARFRWARFIRTVVIGILLCVCPLGLLAVTQGWYGTLTQMGWFFTKAGLLTFGGAYAVLPYVYQAAVAHYHWVTPAQMIDGLGLGETTPGPLIIVVAFVGFIGGYMKDLFGPGLPFVSGAVAAVVVAWFTFLPSFLFIFAGAPLIESTRGHITFTAPLTAITAAVVGVVLNLAAFFAYHVLWPDGFSSSVNWASVLIAFVAVLLLFRFKRNVIEVLLVCAGMGLALKSVAL